jgi:hypothetical protein
MQVKQLLTIPETTSRKDSLVGGTGGGGLLAATTWVRTVGDFKR